MGSSGGTAVGSSVGSAVDSSVGAASSVGASVGSGAVVGSTAAAVVFVGVEGAAVREGPATVQAVMSEIRNTVRVSRREFIIEDTFALIGFVVIK